jgi:hypothetical protein
MVDVCTLRCTKNVVSLHNFERIIYMLGLISAFV